MKSCIAKLKQHTKQRTDQPVTFAPISQTLFSYIISAVAGFYIVIIYKPKNIQWAIEGSSVVICCIFFVYLIAEYCCSVWTNSARHIVAECTVRLNIEI